MKTASTWLIIRAIKLVLVFSIWTGFSYGQDIDDDPLPAGNVAYSPVGIGVKEMHKKTSQSVVWFKRHPERYMQVPGSGTGYFIQTDPKLDHYCFLTAGHVLYDGNDVLEKNRTMLLDMAFQTVYINPRSNPATYQAVVGRPSGVPVSTTVVVAKVNGKGTLSWKDYALVKVPKSEVSGIPFRLHGFQFLANKSLPLTRLNDDAMKSAYVIHHKEGRPQQISTLQKRAYVQPGTNPTKQYSSAWAMPNWSGALGPGASGAPLVLPTLGGTFIDPPAIGIYVGRPANIDPPYFPMISPTDTSDFVFVQLATPELKNYILANCTGNLKEDEYKTSQNKPVALNTKALEDLLDEAVSFINKDIDYLKGTSLTTLNLGGSGSAAEAITALDTYKQKANALKQLIKANGAPAQIQSQVLELDLRMTAIESRLERLTLKPSLTPLNPSTVQANAVNALTYLGRYLLEVLVSNSVSRPIFDKPIDARYVYTNLALTIPTLKTRLSSVQDRMLFLANNIFSPKRAKRDITGQPPQVQAPNEVVSLQQKVLETIQAVNSYLLSTSDFQNNNLSFLFGAEYFYNNRETNSNRFLLTNFYEEEYLITEYIAGKIDEEIAKAKTNKTTYSTAFVTDCTQKVNEIRDYLSRLKAANYPKSFITVVGSKVGNLAYSTFNDKANFTINNYTPDLNWQKLDLSYSQTNSFGYQYISPGLSTNLKAIEGKYESYFTFPCLSKTKVSLGNWYSSRFKVTGTINLDNIGQITIHPYLQDFLNRNAITLQKKGSVASRSGSENKMITYDYVFDQAKLPNPGEGFVTGFNIDNYIKTQTEKPALTFGQRNNMVSFEMASPEILLVARALKQVSCVVDAPGYEHSTEEETNRPNDYVGYNLYLMKRYVGDYLTFKYRIELDNTIGWDFDLSIAESESPIVPGKYYQIKNRGTGRYIEPSGDTGLQMAQGPGNSGYVDDWRFSLNADGSYSIYERMLNPYYVAEIPGSSTTSGIQLTLNRPNDGLNQKWEIIPSPAKFGYYVIRSLVSSNSPLQMTATTNPNYWESGTKIMSVPLDRTAYQDWTFESGSGARQSAVSIPTETVIEEDQNRPVLHPNPVTDQLQLNLPVGYEQSVITISTASGAGMNLFVENQGLRRVVDVRSLKPGLYFIQVQCAGKPRHALKFLKQ
ncbi:T9SS type A sorting domain-containing protein [Larkinella punicea]|nr:T9SS type A sorting domain-containing protein [Larkinella punicea]